MKYFSTDSRPDYSCPLVGNGDIAFNPDCEGSVIIDPVVRAGRRQMYKYNQKTPAPLLPYGTLKFNTDADVINFTQELIEYDGYVSSVCEYDNGNMVKTYGQTHGNNEKTAGLCCLTNRF